MYPKFNLILPSQLLQDFTSALSLSDLQTKFNIFMAFFIRAEPVSYLIKPGFILSSTSYLYNAESISSI
jgi:hypothetical protein